MSDILSIYMLYMFIYDVNQYI
ncbi:hypothetical protein EZS27_034094, partial [termite gut metagenome]